MDPNDLLKKLGLDDGLGKPTGKAAPGTAVRPAAPAKPASATVLDLDKWDVARGADLLGRSPNLSLLKLPDAEAAVADLHAVAFKPYPELLDSPADPVRAAFVKALLESGDTQALRVSTVLNGLASDIAATEFAKSYSVMLNKQKDQPKKPQQSQQGEPGDGEGEGQGDGEDADQDPTGGAAAAAARAAAQKASEEVEAMEEAAAAFGHGQGSGMGSPGAAPNQKAIAELFQQVRNNPVLRQITELAGRFRRVAQAKQRQKARHGVDETTGITTGGKISRLLTRELARLTDPDLELDVLRRIIDKQAMIKEIKGKEGVGKGPVIVCVDESGSMIAGYRGGPPKYIQARALALTMVWVARHQRRWIALIGFKDGRTPFPPLLLAPGTHDDAALMQWLLRRSSGGTDDTVVCRQLPGEFYPAFVQQGMREGKTDLLVISDGELRVPLNTAARFNAWKKETKCRAIGLMIGTGPGGWKDVLDECHLCNALTGGDEGVGKALSI